MTHAKGESRVAVPGLSAFREVENDPNDDEDDEIVTNQTDVEVRATADPTLPWPVDPTLLEAGGGSLRTESIAQLAITPGRTARAPFTLDLS